MGEAQESFLQRSWGWVATIFLSALYIYLELTLWKKHGDDLMLTAANIVVTVALWIVLLLTIARYWRRAKRAKDLEGQILTIRDEHKAELDRVNRSCEVKVNHAETVASSAHADARTLTNELAAKDSEFAIRLHEKELEWSQQISRLNTEISELRETSDAARPPFALSPLQEEAFECAKKLRDWVATVGPLATPSLIAGESDEERARRTESTRAAYRARLKFEYESDYRDRVQAVYRKFAIENYRDLWFETVMGGIGHEETALNMANSLEALAIRQFAPKASELIINRLNPLIKTVQL